MSLTFEDECQVQAIGQVEKSLFSYRANCAKRQKYSDDFV